MIPPSDASAVVSAMRDQACDFLSKPFEIGDLSRRSSQLWRPTGHLHRGSVGATTMDRAARALHD